MDPISGTEPPAAPSGPFWETETEILPIRSRLIDYSRPPAGTHLTTGRRAQRGYRLSKFCMGFIDPRIRERFATDGDAYMQEFGLSDYEQALVRRQDWRVMVRYGVNAFMILKLSNACGVSQHETGAQMRGQPYPEFMAFLQQRAGA